MTSKDHQRREKPPERAQGILVRSEDSDGAFALLEYDIPPRTLVAPLHTHHHEDEYSYVLIGTVGAQIGERTLTAGPHRLIAKAKGIPHTLWNPGDTPTRVLELIVPGGFERCLAQLYRSTNPSQDELEALWRQYGIDVDWDSAPKLMKQHRLRAVAVR